MKSYKALKISGLLSLISIMLFFFFVDQIFGWLNIIEVVLFGSIIFKMTMERDDIDDSGRRFSRDTRWFSFGVFGWLMLLVNGVFYFLMSFPRQSENF